MSRTIRRNTQVLINRYVGTLDEFIACPPSGWMRRYPDLTPVQLHERLVARFTRDRHSGIHGVPRCFRQQRFNDKERRYERKEIHRCLKAGEWDDHLTGQHSTGARWLWHWIMS